jgi:hypothetical protein
MPVAVGSLLERSFRVQIVSPVTAYPEGENLFSLLNMRLFLRCSQITGLILPYIQFTEPLFALSLS